MNKLRICSPILGSEWKTIRYLTTKEERKREVGTRERKREGVMPRELVAIKTSPLNYR